jgi:ketosteroid isomerase-like protein
MADIDDLQATFEQFVGAFNAHNLDAWAALCHDGVVSFQLFSPFPVDGKAALRQVHQTTLANSESASATHINPQFRVIGTTGVVWAHTALVLKPKDGPMTAVFARSTFTFAKSDGRWLMVASHISQLPAGN